MIRVTCSQYRVLMFGVTSVLIIDKFVVHCIPTIKRIFRDFK